MPSRSGYEVDENILGNRRKGDLVNSDLVSRAVVTAHRTGDGPRGGFGRGGSGYSCEMLEVTVTKSSPASTLVTVSGELAGPGAERLLARLDRLLDNGHRYVVLDLSGVTFCDSSGVSALVRGHARASAAAGGLKVSAASVQVTRVLELSGLGRMLGLPSTVEA
ncbi:anti-anti-sigma factor [Lentzea albida]|uniref:Anti-anti-sigma factor n=2 Tax=Lentzea albida TaxID=65499 RepID=A0A1H9PG15_9PSEU|nr:anti-anti-sigma factor [Lentzea albida]